MVDFLSGGLINDTKYIDYATKEVTGADIANGNELYDTTCAMCHGKQIDFGGGEGVGALSDSLGGTAQNQVWTNPRLHVFWYSQ